MKMVDIGFIGALEAEVSELINALSNKKEEKVGGITFYTGSIFGKKIAVARCGVGKVFAAMCAQAMIVKYSPKLIVNTGVAGSLSKELKVFDMLICRRACQYDMDTSATGDPIGLISGINRVYFESCNAAVECILNSVSDIGISVKVGTVATGDRFVASPEMKKYIKDNFDAMACEMEGGAVAQVAYVNNTDFLIIRAISDSADDSADMDYMTFLPIAAANSSKLCFKLIENYNC